MTQELSVASLPGEHKKTMYNRYHVLKHKAKTSNISFAWGDFDSFMDDVFQRYKESKRLKDEPFDPNNFRLSFEKSALAPDAKGYCVETLTVVGYSSNGEKLGQRRKQVRPKQKFTPKMGDEVLFTESEAVKLFRASAQLTVLLQELDGDIETLVSLAHEAADAMNFNQPSTEVFHGSKSHS